MAWLWARHDNWVGNDYEHDTTINRTTENKQLMTVQCYYGQGMQVWHDCHQDIQLSRIYVDRAWITTSRAFYFYFLNKEINPSHMSETHLSILTSLTEFTFCWQRGSSHDTRLLSLYTSAFLCKAIFKHIYQWQLPLASQWLLPHTFYRPAVGGWVI